MYKYPLAMDGNVLVMSVANDAFVYTRGRDNDNNDHDDNNEWRRESMVLPSDGNYTGYSSASLLLSD